MLQILYGPSSMEFFEIRTTEIFRENPEKKIEISR